jgi:RNA 2',3'-cyclic 3'-phosphodiesterase
LGGVRAKHPHVRWLPIEKLHLTLVFLGQTEASRVGALSEAIAEVAAHLGPFGVRTGDAGGRVGGRRGGVAWLRLADGGHEVAQLSIDVDDAIGTNVYDARNAPRPHLTLARRATKGSLEELRGAASSLELSWLVDRIVLFRSHTGPGGSLYEELFSNRLEGR